MFAPKLSNNSPDMDTFNRLSHKLIICDLDENFTESACQFFSALDVQICHGPVEAQKGIDCIVWPGNAQALCVSGLDKTVTEWFGSSVLEGVRNQIYRQFGEEGAPIGWTHLVEVQKSNEMQKSASNVKYLVYAVVFPRSVDGPRKTMFNALDAVAQYNLFVRSSQTSPGKNSVPEETSMDRTISCVICPGLGTFRGLPETSEVAALMASGVQEFIGAKEAHHFEYMPSHAASSRGVDA